MPAASGGARAREIVAANPKTYMIEQAVWPLTCLFGVIVFLALGVAQRPRPQLGPDRREARRGADILQRCVGSCPGWWT